MLPPLLGSYFATPEKLREQHPAVATLLGPTAALGAKARNTGESELGTAAAAGAIPGGLLGALIGGIAGAETAYQGKAGKAGKAAIMTALAGSVLGAGAGALGGSISYGTGHLFGDRVPKKEYK